MMLGFGGCSFSTLLCWFTSFDTKIALLNAYLVRIFIPKKTVVIKI